MASEMLVPEGGPRGLDVLDEPSAATFPAGRPRVPDAHQEASCNALGGVSGSQHLQPSTGIMSVRGDTSRTVPRCAQVLPSDD